ncbi:hypothetical protein FH972_022939 [Carpinus fangiana]|uniref:Uncharacterized protein n=1 Tax=Carpinus fangiana TaxID=176857 RepID=A0A5N6KU02_9ROSI|nr:hypothetical protein FH972_022939 [Carpinus fangiana]
MPIKQTHRAGICITQIKGANNPVDACGRQHRPAVLIPVVRQQLRRALRLLRRDARHLLGAHVGDGDGHHEVIRGAGGGAQVPDADITVCADGTDDAVIVGRKLCAVCTAVGGQDGVGVVGGAGGVEDLDGAVPAGAEEVALRGQVPMHAVDLAAVGAPLGDGELGDADVVELDGAVARGCEQLVLVRLGPGEVVEGVLGVEVLLLLDTLGGQAEDVEPAVADDAKVLAGGHGHAAVIEGRVFGCKALEAGGAEFKHDGWSAPPRAGSMKWLFSSLSSQWQCDMSLCSYIILLFGLGLGGVVGQALVGGSQ